MHQIDFNLISRWTAANEIGQEITARPLREIHPSSSAQRLTRLHLFRPVLLVQLHNFS